MSSEASSYGFFKEICRGEGNLFDFKQDCWKNAVYSLLYMRIRFKQAKYKYKIVTLRSVSWPLCFR